MKEQISHILEQHWGYKNFRPLQEDIILSVLEKKDTLALLPTGGGKSICFQVPALVSEGICLVITPLIALMKDQVERLTLKGIKAIAIYSGMNYREIEQAFRDALMGNYKFMYLSPERLQTDIFLNSAREMKVNLIAVDEAHCISEWGYDFRPSYLKISEIRSYFPGIPMLALTASATTEVRKDIAEKLHFTDYRIFRQSFDRKNLIFSVLHEESKPNKIKDILGKVPGSGIVYTRTRKSTIDVARFLNQNRISADFYHGGLTNEQRTLKQNNWMSGKTRIMVSTNAFGMGIDKADVRTVIHFHLPDSMEAFYQEAGRAGRDLQKSYSVAIVNENDKDDLKKRLSDNFPDIKEIKNVYNALGNYLQIPAGSGENSTFDFDIRDFCNHFKLEMVKTFSCLKFLENQGLILLVDEPEPVSRLHILYSHQELYDFQLNNPVYESLLKTLLRSYDGLYDIYTRINENEIAKRLDIQPDEVKNKLKMLAAAGLVDYLPRKEKSQLVFVTARLADSSIGVDHKSIFKRKKLYEHKLREVINYSFNYNGCKTKFILAYFGEIFEDRCGHCDYCLKMKKIELTDEEFTEISTKIIDLLGKSKINLLEITDKLPLIKKEKLNLALRLLIDLDKISLNKENQLSLPK